MDVVRALTRSGGAARLEGLRRAGVGRRALAVAVTEGRVTRPLRGCYAVPDASRDAILRAAYRAELSCTSLCSALGLPVMTPDPATHLWVPRNRARRRDDARPGDRLVLHRHDHEAPRPAQRIQVGLDLLGLCADRLQQIVALDQALRRGLLRRSDLERWVHTAPERRAWLQRRCDGRAMSLIETLVRVVCEEAGLRVEPQAEIEGVGHVDLLVEGGLVVETDGSAFHLDHQAWREDLRRGRALTLGGMPYLRFTYADVMTNLPAVVRQIERALGRV